MALRTDFAISCPLTYISITSHKAEDFLLYSTIVPDEILKTWYKLSSEVLAFNTTTGRIDLVLKDSVINKESCNIMTIHYVAQKVLKPFLFTEEELCSMYNINAGEKYRKIPFLAGRTSREQSFGFDYASVSTTLQEMEGSSDLVADCHSLSYLERIAVLSKKKCNMAFASSMIDLFKKQIDTYETFYYA